VSCVPCGPDMFSTCDGWFDDEILDKFHEPIIPQKDFSLQTPSFWTSTLTDPPAWAYYRETSSKPRERLEKVTAGWTKERTFKILPKNESTGIQIEMIVRSGSADRCCLASWDEHAQRGRKSAQRIRLLFLKILLRVRTREALGGWPAISRGIAGITCGVYSGCLCVAAVLSQAWRYG